MTWWMVGLGAVWGLLTLPTLFVAIMAIPGNPGPGDPMLMLPPLFLTGALLLAIACVGGVAFGFGWLSPHGFWRGETLLVAPLVYALLGAVLLVDSRPIRLGLLASAALLVWLVA